MSQSASICYSSDAMQRLEPIVSEFMVTASSGAPTISSSYLGYPVFIGGAAADFTQALVDSFLGSTSEFAVTTAFGSTSMGTNVFGFVLNLQGQAKSALWVMSIGADSASPPVGTVKVAQGQGTVTTVLADTLVSNVAITTAGNVYGKISTLGFDTGASNVLLVRVAWLPK